MEDFTPPKDTLEDAQIKFQRLCEIANDIETNGAECSDKFAQQIIISAILKSDNEFLNDILEQALFDENHSRLLKTMLTGLLSGKKITKPLIRLVHETFPDVLDFDEEKAKMDCLLLAADGIVSALRDESHDSLSCTSALYKIYVAACLEKNDFPIADKLLQHFINTLPAKSKEIDAMLLNIIKDSSMEINPKLVAIEILTRSLGGEIFENLEDILLNIDSYSKNQQEKLYLLDVITKAFSAMLTQGVGVSYERVIDILNNIEFIPCSNNPELFAIINRIEQRIENINEMYNRVN